MPRTFLLSSKFLLHLKIVSVIITKPQKHSFYFDQMCCDIFIGRPSSSELYLNYYGPPYQHCGIHYWQTILEVSINDTFNPIFKRFFNLIFYHIIHKFRKYVSKYVYKCSLTNNCVCLILQDCITSNFIRRMNIRDCGLLLQDARQLVKMYRAKRNYGNLEIISGRRS